MVESWERAESGTNFDRLSQARVTGLCASATSPGPVTLEVCSLVWSRNCLQDSRCQRWQKAWGGTNRHILSSLESTESISLMRWIWKSWSTLYEWLHSHPKQNAAGDFSCCATCLQWTTVEYGKGVVLEPKDVNVRSNSRVCSVIVVSKTLKSMQIQSTPQMHLRYLWDFQPHQGNKNSPERQAARFLFQTLVGTGIDGAISRSSASNKFRAIGFKA